MSRSLAARLARLEGRLGRVQQQRSGAVRHEPAEPKQRAVSALLDVLERHYPAPPAFPGARPKLSTDAVRAAAERISAGAPSADDLAALHALPPAQLQAFGHSAEDFINVIARVLDPAWRSPALAG